MEKHSWNKVHCNLKSSSHPSSRWGHSCCQIEDDIVFFGGYADSSYMNDVWTFNTLTMDWTQIQTTGSIPSQRSNCSMSYDQKNNRIVLFGGGAPNKKRFNSIHLLDWKTKQWIEVLPKENQSTPWERTYHTAEFFYPYLIIYGGEGMTDMDDAWAYNFQTQSWIQIQIQADSAKPCARRFHSSAKIGNKLYIIAGCHTKYRCLNDIWQLDVTELIKNGSSTLKWKQIKMKGTTFLTRWGHSSVVYQDKIYIFGGRFSNDLNDILVADLEKNTMKSLRTTIELPKARRRHSACFVGSNMAIFGGFNGEYFNDLHYINVFELKKKVELNNKTSIPKSDFVQFVNNYSYSDGIIISSDGFEIPVHKAFIRRCFSQQIKMQQFLAELNNYTRMDIIDILDYLYKGYENQQFIENYLSLAENFEINLSQSESDKQVDYFKKIFYETKQLLSIAPKKSSLLTSSVICLGEQEYINFLEVVRREMYTDASIVFNRQYCLPVSKSIVSLNSEYFKGLFSNKYLENDQIHLNWECSQTCIIIFEVLINYLIFGRVIVSKQFELQHWTQLVQLAEYYSLNHLKQICEQQLISFVPNGHCEQLMTLSLHLNLSCLGVYCADHQIKLMVNKQEKYHLEYNQHQNQRMNEKRQSLLKHVYSLLRFDILQTRIEAENQLEYGLKKKNSQTTDCGEEKENYQNNLKL